MKCARVAAAASVVGLYEEGNKMSGDLIYLNTGSSGIVHPEPQILLVRMIFLRNTFFFFCVLLMLFDQSILLLLLQSAVPLLMDSLLAVLFFRFSKGFFWSNIICGVDFSDVKRGIVL